MVLDETQAVLEQAGYRTAFQFEPIKSLYFEDSSLMGFAVLYPSARELLGEWNELQNTFLQENAPRLRGDRQKAWNIYAVLLAEEAGSDEEVRELSALEEDYTATRKIAQSGVRHRNQIRQALAPLLPISMPAEAHEAAERLKAKLDEAEAAFLRQILSSALKPEEVAQWLTSL